MRPLARRNEDAAALPYNLIEIGRKPNQNRVLEDLVNVLLEAGNGFDNVVAAASLSSARIGRQQLVNAAKHIA
jgi:hypothetical protein